jgi:hypothetical protein
MIPFREGRNRAASRQTARRVPRCAAGHLLRPASPGRPADPAVGAAPGAELQLRGGVLSTRSVLSIAMLVAAALIGALGLAIFLTERGVANEIKGFVLMLIAAVLLVGGCVLWELRAIRRRLEGKDQG